MNKSIVVAYLDKYDFFIAADYNNFSSDCVIYEYSTEHDIARKTHVNKDTGKVDYSIAISSGVCLENCVDKLDDSSSKMIRGIFENGLEGWDLADIKYD